jgi:hypothetical protein
MIQEGFDGPQLELAQPFRTCGTAEAIELVAVNTEEEDDVTPAEDGAEEHIEFVEKERVGHGELEGGGYAHSSQTPGFLALSSGSPVPVSNNYRRLIDQQTLVRSVVHIGRRHQHQ